MSNNPFSHNGSALVGMVGQGCVALASDMRLGVGFQTISTSFPKIFRMQDNILMGLTGLATDIITFHKKIKHKLEMYRLRENRDMSARTFASLIGTTLYEHRFGPFFVVPIVVGLERDGTAVICTYDSIGTQSTTEKFASAGTASDNFDGLCESYYRDNLKPDEIGDVLANILTSGTDRDILSGWGGVVYVVTPDYIDVKYLKGKLV